MKLTKTVKCGHHELTLETNNHSEKNIIDEFFNWKSEFWCEISPGKNYQTSIIIIREVEP